MSDDKQLIEVLSLKKTLRPAATIDTNYIKDGKLVYEMFTRNIKSRDISPRLAGQVEAIIELSNDILKTPKRLFRGTLRRRKLYKQLELLEGGLQKLVDGIKVADEGTKEAKRLQAVNNEEKKRYQMEKTEKERKITETEIELKRMESIQKEEKKRHQMEKTEKERKITETEMELKRMESETEMELKRMEGVQKEEEKRHQMEKAEKERKIMETEMELKRMEGVQKEEEKRHQMEKAEKERKIMETEMELKRMEGVQKEEEKRYQMEKAEKERKIMETEMELKRMEGVQKEEEKRHQMEKAEKERKIMETEIELKRMEGVQKEAIRKQAVQRILFNYGDYVADRCLTYKQSMQWDRQYSAKYWSEIHEIIESEKEMKEKARSLLQESPSTPMLSHLAMVALDLKVPVADILWDISAYTERNKLCHTDIAIMVKQGNWMKLAQRTQIDYENVDALLPEDYKDWALPLKSAIKQFQDKYFSELKIVRTLHITGGFEIRDYTLNTKADDARRAQEEVALEVALERKKKADNQRQLKMEKKQARKELRASKDSERVSSTGTVLRHQDSALEMAVEGVFSTLEDATNGLKKIVNREYIHLYEDVEEAGIEVTERNGLVKWHSSDAGEGEEVSLYVQKHSLRAPGSIRQREWGVESGDEDLVEEKQEEEAVEDMEE